MDYTIFYSADIIEKCDLALLMPGPYISVFKQISDQ